MTNFIYLFTYEKKHNSYTKTKDNFKFFIDFQRPLKQRQADLNDFEHSLV